MAQGLLLDPLAASTRLRVTDLIRRPFADVALGGRIATGDRAAQRTGTFDVEAFGRPGVLVALAVLGETQARDGGRSNSDGDGNALQAFFGLQASERDALVATLTLGGGRQQLPDQEYQFPGGLDQVTFGEEASATLGWSHRLGPRNRLMLQAAASHEERRLDLAGFDVELIDQRSRGVSLELRHLLGLGAADLSWGLVAGALDAAGMLRRLPDAADGLAAVALRHAGRPGAEPPADALLRLLTPSGFPPRVSYWQALAPDPSLPSGLFRGRIALVGLDLRQAPEVGSGSPDTFLTPLTRTDGLLSSGASLQAVVIENLARRAWITPRPGLAVVPALEGARAFLLDREGRARVRAAFDRRSASRPRPRPPG